MSLKNLDLQFKLFPIYSFDNSLKILKQLLIECSKFPQTSLFSNRILTGYGDRDTEYNFKQFNIPGKSWTPTLILLKNLVQHYTNESYNYVLVNILRNGNDYVQLHKELEFATARMIFGADRKIIFFRNDSEHVSFKVCNGMLLEIKGLNNIHWSYAIPQINSSIGITLILEFRYVYPKNRSNQILIQEHLLTCPICLQYILTDKITTCCNHKFHLHCLNMWIYNMNKTCPYCREEIVLLGIDGCLKRISKYSI